MLASITLPLRSAFNAKTFFEIHLHQNPPIFQQLPHPDYPYLTLIGFRNLYHVPKEVRCFLWYTFELYRVAIVFDVYDLSAYLLQMRFIHQLPDHASGLMKMLEWFHPLPWWQNIISVHPGGMRMRFIHIHFYCPHDFITTPDANFLVPHEHEEISIQCWSPINIAENPRFYHNNEFREFMERMAALNHVQFADIPAHIAIYPFADGDPGLQLRSLDEFVTTHLSELTNIYDEFGRDPNADSDFYSTGSE